MCYICTCVQVILAWDDAEVGKIIDMANKTLDRLQLVLAAKSMRAVVVCYSVGYIMLSKQGIWKVKWTLRRNTCNKCMECSEMR